jgi:hypothetical protein
MITQAMGYKLIDAWFILGLVGAIYLGFRVKNAIQEIARKEAEKKTS